MKQCKLITMLLLSLFICSTFALTSEEIAVLYENLITESMEKGQDYHHRREGSNCYQNEDSITLSCFEAGPHWITDFNKDGEKDILIKLLDQGLGGGGNAYGYTYEILILKNGKVVDQHTILGGGKFSLTHLTIDDVHNGVVYGTEEGNTWAGEPESTTDVQYKVVGGKLVKH